MRRSFPRAESGGSPAPGDESDRRVSNYPCKRGKAVSKNTEGRALHPQKYYHDLKPSPRARAMPAGGTPPPQRFLESTYFANPRQRGSDVGAEFSSNLELSPHFADRRVARRYYSSLPSAVTHQIFMLISCRSEIIKASSETFKRRRNPYSIAPPQRTQRKRTARGTRLFCRREHEFP